jgi:magnesium transporter
MLKTVLNSFHLQDINNPLHPAAFMHTPTYDILIMRLPYENANKVLEVKSNVLIFKHDEYYIYEVQKQEFVKLDGFKQVHESLDEKVNQTMQLVDAMYNEIEDMEDAFYESETIHNFNQVWFSHKNSLIRINRILNKTIEEFKVFMQHYSKKENFLHINFSDILEHLQRTHRNSGHALEKLDALYNFYSSVNNEKMNKTVYVLTLLSGVFLPLNLLVGFFGMNTTHLPFTQEDFGTYWVISLLIVFGLMSYFGVALLKKNKIQMKGLS